MRVFLSWSGDPSRELAEAVFQWLPNALQFVKPYYSPSDIDKGARWANEISKNLEEAQIALLILTKHNLSSEWIMFEAGAISKLIDQARVCPVLFGLEPTDISGPLAQFQATQFVKSDMRKLFETINNAAGDERLHVGRLDDVFDTWWPRLEASVTGIPLSGGGARTTSAPRSNRDIMEETLQSVRSLTRLIEHNSALVASADERDSIVPYGRTLYNTILNYVMQIVNRIPFDQDLAEATMHDLRDLEVEIMEPRVRNVYKRNIVADIVSMRQIILERATLDKKGKFKDDEDEIPF